MEQSKPLAEELAAVVEANEPNWHATVAKRSEDLEPPSEWQAAVLAAAADGNTAKVLPESAFQCRRPYLLLELLRDCDAHELAAARLPPSGGTPLHLVAADGSVAAVQALLRSGCHIHARAINGSTPLHWAAGGGNTAVVRELLAAGAHAEARSSTWCATVRGNDSGQTAAHWAAATGHWETLAVLLGSDPHALLLQDERQLTPAGLAAREGFTGVQMALHELMEEQVVCVRVHREMTVQKPIAMDDISPHEDGHARHTPRVDTLSEASDEEC
mmetsp:Transcript_47475/g.78567  ORF Transcript_47475/g.78567 Transcript_47475/m.78567 type:complete len:273 (+) Transcript_47475:2-820(+)